MSIVVDASMAIAWLLPDERTTASMDVLQRLSSEQGLVPTIFRHEVRNILLVSERRRRVSADEVDEILSGLAHTSIEDNGPGDDHRVMALARAYGLTAYDAAYVSLALSTGSSVATLDKAMAAAARACGVPLLGPLAP